jgi:hypothetical protein
VGFSKTELLQEAKYRRWRGKTAKDYEACTKFLAECVHIQHPEHGALLFDLREAQLDTLKRVMTDRYVIILKARQIGYSTLFAAYCLWLGMFWPDNVIVMLSRNEREAQKLLSKTDYAWKRLPEWLKERAAKRLDKNVMKITFDNGSSIESMPSKEDPARGSAVSLIIVDEWAFFENAEEAWASIEPVTDVGGRVVGLSTANGSGNFFHEFWNKAVSGNSQFTHLFYPWSANTDRNTDWYDVKKANMLPWQLAQEYPDNPEEAFIRSGNPVFDVDMLRAMEVRTPDYGYLDAEVQGTQQSPTFISVSSETNYKQWVPPLLDHQYVIGADVAEGLEHGDYSCLQVICLQTNEQVAQWHGHIDPDLFAEEIAKTAWRYNRALVAVEVNNHGLTTNKALQRLGYPKVYIRRELDGKTTWQNRQTKIGWLTTKASKPLMIDELGMGVRQGFRIHDKATVGEMLTYVRNERGQMGGSPFDDRVVALAIAYQMLRFAVAPEYTTPQDTYGTFDYFKDRLIREGRNSGTPLGANNIGEMSRVL